MEYLELIKKYWRMNEEFPQNYSITCMYLFLLETWDKNNKEDFEISDYDISKKLIITRVSVRKNRKKLRDLGLINYQISKGFPTIYKIISDYIIRKGKEVVSIAEKEKIVDKKSIAPAIPVIPLVQEPIPVASPSLKSKEKQTPMMPFNIPSFEEFMNYAKTLDIYEEGLDVHLKIKYETWKDDGWVSGYNKPIINWKQTLKNTMPYLRSNNKNIFNVPKINRPKSTYNE